MAKVQGVDLELASKEVRTGWEDSGYGAGWVI
jgi:hypothetical protein